MKSIDWKKVAEVKKGIAKLPKMADYKPYGVAQEKLNELVREQREVHAALPKLEEKLDKAAASVELGELELEDLEKVEQEAERTKRRFRAITGAIRRLSKQVAKEKRNAEWTVQRPAKSLHDMLLREYYKLWQMMDELKKIEDELKKYIQKETRTTPGHELYIYSVLHMEDASQWLRNAKQGGYFK